MRKLIIFLLISVFSSGLLAESNLPKGIIKVTPRPAPTLNLENMDGEKYTPYKNPSRWRFVHFWASWCGPCRREMPSIQKLIKAMSKDKLEFVIVNTAESEDTVFSFLGGVAPDINTLLDRDGLATERWRPRGLPSTYLVDPSGQIQYVVIGGQDWQNSQYQQFLRKLTINNDKNR